MAVQDLYISRSFSRTMGTDEHSRLRRKQNGCCLNGQHYHIQWVEFILYFLIWKWNYIWVQVVQTKQGVCNCVKQSFEALALSWLLPPWKQILNIWMYFLWVEVSTPPPKPTDSFKLINLSASFVTQDHTLHERLQRKKVLGWSERNTNYCEHCLKMNDFQSDAWKKTNRGENSLGMNCACW